ncbi:hypothetical protein B0H13DRAFT_1601475, partial [Mycena leptocephala]
TSYKTRHSSYGEPTGCMAGTRTQVLADLDAWAMDDNSKKVYWMVGIAGTEKSTIAQTFCEILDERHMLGANFFCSRASENTNNARLIIPSIAHALSRASPSIKSQVIEDDLAIAEPTYVKMDDQFIKLIVQPTRTSVGAVKRCKIVVIDAVDECRDLRLVSSFIRLILTWASEIPLKIFIASRDVYPIRQVFDRQSAETFYLHEVEKNIVKDDIAKYITTSLQKIHGDNHGNKTTETWPPQSEVSTLVNQSGALFIYAATAIRYIAEGETLYKARFAAITQGSSSQMPPGLDGLYVHILRQVFRHLGEHEIIDIRLVMSMIVFLRTPLSMQSIVSLSNMDASGYLSRLATVIHIPSNTQSTATVTAFHASFPDFVTDSARCSSTSFPTFSALNAAEGHRILASSCLEFMNRPGSLHYNMGDVPEELIVSHRGRTNTSEGLDKIPEALKYSCRYSLRSSDWASHISETQTAGTELIKALHVFFHAHLLHWIECLSALGELPTVLESLADAATALSLLVEDARRCLQANFECIETHRFEIYQSALVWLPKTSLIRKVYANHLPRAPRLTVGLSDSWGSTELVLDNLLRHRVKSVAVSPDDRRVVSGSDDNMVWIWNAITGMAEATLDGHTAQVNSVVFSAKGNQIISGSNDCTVRIWNAATGEADATLEGHTDYVSSVASSSDGRRIVSGSRDRIVRIWNVTTGETEVKLLGHTDRVNCVAFSKDDSRVGSGSNDHTVRIWGSSTGELQVKLEGHKDYVNSLAFSPDGSRIASGSSDCTVRMWDASTGRVKAKLEGHSNYVNSVAFSSDGWRIVSGSRDRTVKIWNATTGVVEAQQVGHTNAVNSVAFSHDGKRVIFVLADCTVQICSVNKGELRSKSVNLSTVEVTCLAFSLDGTRVVSGLQIGRVQIWNTTTGKEESKVRYKPTSLDSVAFSPDGRRIICGTSEAIIIYNGITGEMENKIETAAGSLTPTLCRTVAFSPDAKRLVTGSDDTCVRIWNATTGELEALLEGHKSWVVSAAISQDGRRVVSGSTDGRILVWNAMTGSIEATLESHTHRVNSVAFAEDSNRVLCLWTDGTARMWDVPNGTTARGNVLRL